jgi:hypothetical protein
VPRGVKDYIFSSLFFKNLANPKSAILALPSNKRILSGLMSL